MRRRKVIAILVVTLGFLVSVLVTHRKDSREDRERSVVSPTSHSFQRKRVVEDEVKQVISSRKNRLSEEQRNGLVDQAKNQILAFFRENEAGRSRMLLERKYATAIGYVFGVEAPNHEDIVKLRSQIASVMDSIPKGDLNKFDVWLGDTIRIYDPFGEYGQKIIFIRVPDSSGKRITGMTYSADNFDAEVEKFKKTTPGRERRRNLISIVGTDDGIADRFEALITVEPVTR